MQDYIVGPFDQNIKTANLPVLSSIIGLAYDGGTPFQAEVYFINLAHIVQVKFGVPYFDIYDSRFPDFGVPAAVRGTISFCIQDYKKFIQINRLRNFELHDFEKQIKDAVCRYVKDVVTNTPAENNIPVVQIETKTSMINDRVEYDLAERLSENFGVSVSGVDIGTIELDKSSQGYQKLMDVTRELEASRAKAETSDYIERLRIQREETQYSQHKQTQSANISAFQVEKQAEVGVAGAEALGKMGENGAGNINLGGGSGFNPMAMMTGIAVGGAVGNSIAGTMSGIIGGSGQTTQPTVAPPPIPQVSYHVAINGQASGPYTLSVLQQMVASGQLTPESLVWTVGMVQWEKAAARDDLQSVFKSCPPPIPPMNI